MSLLTILSSVIELSILGIWAITLQTTTPDVPTVMPSDTRSLFTDDPCVPPCWFGLIAGESTSEDVVRMLEQYHQVFEWDREFSFRHFEHNDVYLLDGYYGIEWRHVSTVENVIDIEDAAVEAMQISIDQPTTLAQIFEAYGSPNYVRTTYAFDIVSLNLYYRELNVVVFLTADRETCQMENFLEAYTAYSVYYYAQEDEDTFEAEHQLDRLRRIPDTEWQHWLEGEVSGSCNDAIRHVREITDPEARYVNPVTPTPFQE